MYIIPMSHLRYAVIQIIKDTFVKQTCKIYTRRSEKWTAHKQKFFLIIPALLPRCNHLQEGHGEFSWLGPSLSLDLANARVMTRNIGTVLVDDFFIPSLTSFTQSFRSITSYNTEYLQASLLAQLTYDLTAQYSVLQWVYPPRRSVLSPHSSLFLHNSDPVSFGSLER
jgi:hypothetical protein